MAGSVRGESLNEIHEVGGAVVLNGRRGNQNLIVEGLHQQARIDEFIGEELAVGVVELRTQFYGSRHGIDLVVDGDQLALRNQLGVGAVVGIDFREPCRPASVPEPVAGCLRPA